MSEIKGTGHIYNRPDGRDSKFPLKGFLTGLYSAPQVSLANHVDIIRDQGITGSCVGQAVARAMHIRAKTNFIQAKFPNPYMLYSGGRARTNMDPTRTIEDTGSFPRDVLKFGTEFGACAEDILFTEKDINAKPTWKQLQDATLGISEYRWIDTYNMIERCNQVKLALTAGFPVLLSVVVDDYWDMCSNSNPIPEPAMETARGSHYVCVVGYWAVGGQHTERYLVCNSWGKYWGDYGFGWMSRDRMVHATTDDLAVLESMEIPNT